MSLAASLMPFYLSVLCLLDLALIFKYTTKLFLLFTFSSIHPSIYLSTCACRFIRSDSHNLKYMGIKGLAAIVKDFPQYASDHQMAVIDCLEDPDETLKRKTVSIFSHGAMTYLHDNG